MLRPVQENISYVSFTKCPKITARNG